VERLGTAEHRGSALDGHCAATVVERLLSRGRDARRLGVRAKPHRLGFLGRLGPMKGDIADFARTPKRRASRPRLSSRSTTFAAVAVQALARGARRCPVAPPPTPTTRTWALPTEDGGTVALRTQQVIAKRLVWL